MKITKNGRILGFVHDFRYLPDDVISTMAIFVKNFKIKGELRKIREFNLVFIFGGFLAKISISGPN